MMFRFDSSQRRRRSPLADFSELRFGRSSSAAVVDRERERERDDRLLFFWSSFNLCK